MTQTQHGAMRGTPAAGGPAPDDLTDRYTRDGYAIVPRAFTPAEVAQLRAEALRICRGELGPVTPASTSRTNCRH
jgi:phytanoyl-CoA hydroxylase